MLEVDIRKQSERSYLHLAEELAPSAGLIMNLYFKCIKVDPDFNSVGRFIAQMTRLNPFSKFNFFIKTEDYFLPNSLSRLGEYVVCHPTYNDKREKFYNRLLSKNSINHPYRIIAFLPFSTGLPRQEKNISHAVMPVACVSVSKDNDWKLALRESLKAENYATAIDFNDDPQIIIKALLFMRMLAKNNSSIHFFDPARKYFY
jgi:hypothetical protein